MTEIRLDVELAHPPERVWRAITDAKILGEWFMATGLRPVPGSRFDLVPSGQAGFEQPISGEVVEVDPLRRLAMRWQAPELDARVTLTLARVPGGCRLTLRQSGFFGMQGLLRRRVLHRTYTEMLGRRLPEALDRLAAADGRRRPVGAVASALARRRAQRFRVAEAGTRVAEAGGRRNAARRFRRGSGLRRFSAVGRVRVSRPLSLESTIAIAVSTLPGRRRRTGRARRRRDDRPEWLRVLRGRVYRAKETIADGLIRGRTLVAALLRHPGGRRDRAVMVGGGLLLVIGIVSVIVVAATALYPARPPQVGGGPEPDPGYAELPGRPHPTQSITGSPTSANQSGATTGTNAPGPAGGPLTAAYRTETVRLGGYRGVITLTNSGREPVTGWKVVISLPVLSLTIRDAAGAEHQQSGSTVIFTPTADTRLVPPNGSVLFSFDVDGVGRPVTCAVDGQPCSGVPE